MPWNYLLRVLGGADTEGISGWAEDIGVGEEAGVEEEVGLEEDVGYAPELFLCNTELLLFWLLLLVVFFVLLLIVCLLFAELEGVFIY